MRYNLHSSEFRLHALVGSNIGVGGLHSEIKCMIDPLVDSGCRTYAEFYAESSWMAGLMET